ncbi:hypothetical protein MUN88_12125 [Gracilibacillus caseinilyticus]|uniref:Uncharacterized protein n=1 Tax=Gracilibacillus caseinilyticus TaxID=2932256 RepID=A0ABY4ESJ6_9BACI|nr:hypothetical protein [Gracilibacillus caseinilyticus]UOQ46842.1 hypothetical protein MUN88_12125 [Gracilibacillus caseinilyticus]
MKITLETFRFALLLVLFGTVLSFISYMLLYPMIGENAERYYSWVATIGSFVLLLFLYQKKGWGKGYFKKSILWLSLGLVVLLAMFIPDLSPAHHYSNVFVYSYGFPISFLTVRSEGGSSFLATNLLSDSDVSMDGGIIFNFLIFYFVLHFIFTKTKLLEK